MQVASKGSSLLVLRELMVKEATLQAGSKKNSRSISITLRPCRKRTEMISELPVRTSEAPEIRISPLQGAPLKIRI